MSKKPQAAPVAVPQTYEAANAVLEEYGKVGHELAVFETRLGGSIARITAKIEQKALPLKARQKALAEQIAAYAAQNRAALLTDDRKSHDMPAGRIGWRLNPASVEIKGKLKVADIVKSILELKLRRKFLRLAFTLNKEAMLEKENQEKAKTIPGIKIVTDAETFYIEHKSAQLSKATP